MPLADRVCAHCGTTFSPKPRQKFCNPRCRNLAAGKTEHGKPIPKPRREHRTATGPDVYVVHDATTGWSKVGYATAGAANRLYQIRRDYPELANAVVVARFDTCAAELLEVRILLALYLRRGRGVELVGERFRGVRPTVVARYARAIQRRCEAAVRAGRAAAEAAMLQAAP